MGKLMGIRRRRVLTAGLTSVLGAPFIIKGARAAQKIVIATPGGVYDDILRRSNGDAFTKATGIEVQTVGTANAKILAMYQAGGAPFDVICMGEGVVVPLDQFGALAPIKYDTWKFTDKNDLPAELRRERRSPTYYFATVSVYNTTKFGKSGPKSWAEFWDVKAFPGPRTLADMVTGQPPLEFALIADGVPVDKLYPLDVDRALRSLTRIRASVPKFWDSGALSAQMMSDKEALLGAVWNGRVQIVIEKGAPLAIEWNQAMTHLSCLAVSKTARNPEAAQLYVDFASQPTAQIGFANEFRYGPVNAKAYDSIDPSLQGVLPGSPRLRDMSFHQNAEWWANNRDRVNKAWSSWIFG